MQNCIYQYFSFNDIQHIQELLEKVNYTSELNSLMIRHPFFAFYSEEIIEMSYKTFYSQILIKLMKPNHSLELAEHTTFVILAGVLQQLNENQFQECLTLQTPISLVSSENNAYVAVFEKNLLQQLIKLQSIRQQNELLIFLSQLRQFHNFFAQFKSVDPDCLYFDQSKYFHKLLSNITKENFQTRDIVYREENTNSFLYFIYEGEVELSTYVSYENNQTVLALIENELKHINSNSKIQMNSKDFSDLSKRVRIEILAKGQVFGENEFLEGCTRKTQAKCLNNDTVLYKLSLYVSKFFFNQLEN